MYDLTKLLTLKPYSLEKSKKGEIFIEAVNHLTNFHYDHCLEYKNFLDILNFNPNNQNKLNDLPFLPTARMSPAICSRTN